VRLCGFSGNVPSFGVRLPNRLLPRPVWRCPPACAETPCGL